MIVRGMSALPRSIAVVFEGNMKQRGLKNRAYRPCGFCDPRFGVSRMAADAAAARPAPATCTSSLQISRP
jgi:hypothetical protein